MRDKILAIQDRVGVPVTGIFCPLTAAAVIAKLDRLTLMEAAATERQKLSVRIKPRGV